VELKAQDEVKQIHDVTEMLELVCGMEQEAIGIYNQWALECAAAADSASRKLFEQLVDDEERHFGQFDDERGNLRKFGNEYLALQSMERSKNSSGQGGPPA
jgi:bacterioferritin